jgi:hypothetical protein
VSWRLKLLRKFTFAAVELTTKFVVSTTLSLTTAGGLTKAQLGGDSGPMDEVAQSGSGPVGFVAIHPGGNRGGVHISKFSLKSVVHGVGDGVTEGVTVAVGVGVGVVGGVGVGVGVVGGVGVGVGVAPPSGDGP